MQNGVGEHENEAHQKLGYQMGQQMMQENPAAGLSQPPGHCHILLAPELEHLAPNEPGQAGPVGGGPFSPRPQAKEMRITRTVWGTPITRSMSQLMKLSMAREPVAAAMPMRTAATALMAEAQIPTVRLVDRPFRVRKNRSRPRWSVPKGWDQEGGSLAWAKSAATALSGIRRPARKATSRTRRMSPVRRSS